MGAIVLAIACLIAIAIPLAATTALRRSQAAASNGNAALALRDARAAANLELGGIAAVATGACARAARAAAGGLERGRPCDEGRTRQLEHVADRIPA